MPGGYKDDDGVIDLRNSGGDEAEFKINPIEEARSVSADRLNGNVAHELEEAAMKSYDKVKVKFDKFVNLIATHAYEEIFDKHADEDVIISTDLLADLANAHEEKPDSKKVPVIFLIGILLGIGVTWILLKT